MDQLLNVTIALGPVALAYALGVLIETAWPDRPNVARTDRFLSGTVLYLSGVLLTLLLVPIGIYGVVAFTELNEFGLLNHVSLPLWLAVVIGVAAYDLSEWVSHLLMHKIPVLWQFHRVHHSDSHLDVATGLRFHPTETVFRYIVTLAVVILLGMNEISVLIFSAIALAFNLWEHSNIVLPRALQPLHHVIITPGLHRVHHSTDSEHAHTNYGIFLSIWDRLAGTKKVVPATERLEYGLDSSECPQDPDRLNTLLLEPFSRAKREETRNPGV